MINMYLEHHQVKRTAVDKLFQIMTNVLISGDKYRQAMSESH